MLLFVPFKFLLILSGRNTRVHKCEKLITAQTLRAHFSRPDAGEEKETTRKHAIEKQELLNKQ